MRRVARLTAAGIGITAGLVVSAPTVWAAVPLESACTTQSIAGQCNSIPQSPRQVTSGDDGSWNEILKDCILTGSKSPNPWVYCPPFGAIPPGGI